jgi:hypothetical protein
MRYDTRTGLATEIIPFCVFGQRTADSGQQTAGLGGGEYVDEMRDDNSTVAVQPFFPFA